MNHHKTTYFGLAPKLSTFQRARSSPRRHKFLSWHGGDCLWCGEREAAHHGLVWRLLRRLGVL